MDSVVVGESRFAIGDKSLSFGALVELGVARGGDGEDAVQPRAQLGRNRGGSISSVAAIHLPIVTAKMGYLAETIEQQTVGAVLQS